MTYWTDKVPGLEQDYMVLKGPEERDKAEEHCRYGKDFGLYAKRYEDPQMGFKRESDMIRNAA